MIDDRDGAAISSDAYQLQLSYIFLGQGYNVATNLVVGSSSFDEANPIFAAKTDTDRVAIDTTLLYRLPTASGRWQALATVLWSARCTDSATGNPDHRLSFRDGASSDPAGGAVAARRLQFAGPPDADAHSVHHR